MSRKLTNVIIDTRLIDDNKQIKRISDYTNAQTQMKWKCTNCANIWETAYSNIYQNKGCPRCAQRSNQLHQTSTNEIIDEKIKANKRPIKRIGDYVTARVKIEWECNICNHHWFSTPDHTVLHRNCPACAGQIAFTNELVDERISKREDNIFRLENIIDSRTKINWGCGNCDNVWQATPTQVVTTRTGCSKCNKRGRYDTARFTTTELEKPSKLYFIKFIRKTTNVSFVKIGITIHTISRRFSGYMGEYEIKVLYINESTLLECINLEQEIIHKFHKYQYIPEGKFGGKTECFIDTPEVKESILKLLE